MKKVLKNIGIIVLLLIYGAGAVWLDRTYLGKKQKEEAKYITKDEIISVINETEELAVERSEYKFSKANSVPRYIGKWSVPLTDNKIDLECTGVLKVGFDLSEMVVEPENNIINITIPRAKVLDNYIIWDTVVCKEDNNILHPIDYNRYKDIIEEAENEGLTDAESKGIYNKANERLEKLIIERLHDIDDREVKITFKD